MLQAVPVTMSHEGPMYQTHSPPPSPSLSQKFLLIKDTTPSVNESGQIVPDDLFSKLTILC